MNTPITNTSFTGPTYILSSHIRPPLSSHISDFHLSLLLPILAYWSLCFVWTLISYYDLFPTYRIHTPTELQTRNRATIREVLRSIILQQIMGVAWGLFIGHMVLGTQDMVGREEYDVALWAERVGKGVSWLAWSMNLGITALGFDSSRMKGAFYLPFHVSITTPDGQIIAWEIVLAQVIYRVLAPAVRFGVAICFSDAWQYFWHRAMHENKWLYRNVHFIHHCINVPYAFGGLYNTLTEAFLVDNIGITLSFYISGLSMREAMLFSTITALKIVDDHSGYKLPWDPLQWLGEQGTVYHDIHHQSWGATTNYSQVYTTFWDHFLGTVSQKSQEEIEELYKKGRDAAEKAKKVN
ncbi:hypothetical protein MFRU_016g01540 [Monilinia fructicola]|nr:hypothetical protein MFRU_016g01540 [Monilinia fructicola]